MPIQLRKKYPIGKIADDQESSPTVVVLNRAFAADPNAIYSLVCNHVPCNEQLAEDPDIQVTSVPLFGDRRYHVGALGLINAVLRANGLPLVSAMFSGGLDENDYHPLMGFCDLQPPDEPPDEPPEDLLESGTMIVNIPACEKHQGLLTADYEISVNCPVCGGPRGKPYRGVSYDGSLRLAADCWINPCGHIDTYASIRETGRKVDRSAETKESPECGA